jgi:hypothetical protein
MVGRSEASDSPIIALPHGRSPHRQVAGLASTAIALTPILLPQAA